MPTCLEHTETLGTMQTSLGRSFGYERRRRCALHLVLIDEVAEHDAKLLVTFLEYLEVILDHALFAQGVIDFLCKPYNASLGLMDCAILFHFGTFVIEAHKGA